MARRKPPAVHIPVASLAPTPIAQERRSKRSSILEQISTPNFRLWADVFLPLTIDRKTELEVPTLLTILPPVYGGQNNE
jgi:hypothetical protein